MKIVLRRFLVLQALLVWQGGFLFYAAVVVPTGTDVLGSSAAQGVITARVTDVMNLIALPALVLLALDQSLTRDPNDRRTAVRWWTWAIAAACQGLLFFFHELLDSFMDPDRTRIVIGPPFRPVHRMYLWTITVQWADCLVAVWLMLEAWRLDDSRESPDADEVSLRRKAE